MRRERLLRMQHSIPKLDALIVDIDDTFLPHRTVAAANQLYIDTFRRMFGLRDRSKQILSTGQTAVRIMKIVFSRLHQFNPSLDDLKRFVLLTWSAAVLHTFFVLRECANKTGISVSNEWAIRFWAETILRLKIEAKDYGFRSAYILNALYKNPLRILQQLRKANPGLRAIGLSQDFSIAQELDPVAKLLSLDHYVSNEFIVKNKIIVSGKTKVLNASDKLRVAEQLIYDNNARIGLMIDDYDDLALLRLKGVRYVWAKKKVFKFVNPKKFKRDFI